MSGFLCQGEKNILNSFSKQKKSIGIFLTGATSRKIETAAPKVDWEESSGTVVAWKEGYGRERQHERGGSGQHRDWVMETTSRGCSGTVVCQLQK